jgi:nitrogen-specific signal transduction histidine kinase
VLLQNKNAVIWMPHFGMIEEDTAISISYEIIKKHGGEIVAESPAGGGAVFTVRLPIARKVQA